MATGAMELPPPADGFPISVTEQGNGWPILIVLPGVTSSARAKRRSAIGAEPEGRSSGQEDPLYFALPLCPVHLRSVGPAHRGCRREHRGGVTIQAHSSRLSPTPEKT